jgi:hypothetical protein
VRLEGGRGDAWKDGWSREPCLAACSSPAAVAASVSLAHFTIIVEMWLWYHMIEKMHVQSDAMAERSRNRS